LHKKTTIIYFFILFITGLILVFSHQKIGEKITTLLNEEQTINIEVSNCPNIMFLDFICGTKSKTYQTSNVIGVIFSIIIFLIVSFFSYQFIIKI